VQTDTSGRRITHEADNRSIIRQDNRVFIQRNETTVIQNFYPKAQTVQRTGGISETVYVRSDGVRVISEVDANGRLLRRYGQTATGGQISYIDNRSFYRTAAVGVAAVGIVGAAVLTLAPPTVAMPRERYIVEHDRAVSKDLYAALSAPAVMKLERSYSLDEVRQTVTLRDRMPRIDLDGITFETASYSISIDQYDKLDRVACALARIIEKNPGEMFLIEGHTDAVGDADDNLSLSDRRAEAVLQVLTSHYELAMENFVTQGYGEQHLKVAAQGSERINRRVTIRRVTPLLAQVSQ
jgi:outer membrane protein OmpA-like peptidoglycan-associated protein